MTFKLDLTSDSNHDYFDLETALSSFGSYESVINSFKQRYTALLDRMYWVQFPALF